MVGLWFAVHAYNGTGAIIAGRECSDSGVRILSSLTADYGFFQKLLSEFPKTPGACKMYAAFIRTPTISSIDLIRSPVLINSHAF